MQLTSRRVAGLTAAGVFALAGLGLSSSAEAKPSASSISAVSPNTLQGQPAAQQTNGKPKLVTGQQARGPLKLDAKGMPQAPKITVTKPKGKTNYVRTDVTGRPLGAKADAVTPDYGNVANVDLSTPYNYCQRGLTYTPVSNTTASTQYYQIVFYNGSTPSRTVYGSVGANTTSWPSYYGVTGTWYAYLYVWGWNGSSYSYVYDEYMASANNCNVSVAFTTASGYTGYVKYTITNNGNAYATVQNRELAPYGYSGTYTGVTWHYPAPYGGSIVVYKYVGTGQRYGLFQDLSGAMFYDPWWQYGSL